MLSSGSNPQDGDFVVASTHFSDLKSSKKNSDGFLDASATGMAEGTRPRRTLRSSRAKETTEQMTEGIKTIKEVSKKKKRKN